MPDSFERALQLKCGGLFRVVIRSSDADHEARALFNFQIILKVIRCRNPVENRYWRSSGPTTKH